MVDLRVASTPLSTALSGTVRVYAADRLTVVDKVPVKKALTMLHRGVADPMDSDASVLIGPFCKPRSVALTTVALSDLIDRLSYLRTGAATYSRDALRVRDQAICGYCGVFCRDNGTMDHILPRSRGGRAEWLNAVWACQPCNCFKAARTPDEAEMPIIHATVFVPTYLDIHDPPLSQAGPSRRGRGIATCRM